MALITKKKENRLETEIEAFTSNIQLSLKTETEIEAFTSNIQLSLKTA